MNRGVVCNAGGNFFGKKMLTALSVAATLVLFSSGVWAKACTDTKNSGMVFGKWNPSAMTTVKNAMASTTIMVEISRGGSEKQKKYLKPNEETNYTASLGGQTNNATIRVQIYPEGSLIAPECKYIVEESKGGSYFDWRLPDGATSVCPNPGDTSIDCQLDFHKQKYRWHTVFTVGDP